jgi:hypothetical protein
MPSAAADPVRAVALVMLWESIGSVDAPVFTGINHICLVTHDLDRSVRTWFDRYGVGPWRIWTKDASNMSAVVDGEPTDFAMRVALCQLSPGFRLEIIQPLDERSPYARSLAERGGADHIHHVRFEVSSRPAARRPASRCRRPRRSIRQRTAEPPRPPRGAAHDAG